MIVVDAERNSGLYDLDEGTGELTRVLKSYDSKDEISFTRFVYFFNPKSYKAATWDDIDEYKENYFDDEGEQVFK